MRLQAETDGRLHEGLVVTENDHHPRAASVNFSNTSQSLPPGTTYNLDITLPDGNFQVARVMMHGPKQMSGGQWYEGAEIHATRDADEAIGQSWWDVSFKKVYAVTYSKQVLDSYLTEKIFDSNTSSSAKYIACTAAVLTGSVLRLTFQNYFGGSATLWVKGKVLAF